MAEEFGIFDGQTTSADLMADLFRGITTQGVVSGLYNSLAVSAGTGLNVTLASGVAMVGGTSLREYVNTTAKTVGAVAAGDAINPRIDTVALRLSTTAKSVTAVILPGVAAASPVAPTPAQTTALWEFPLADVRVEAAASVIGSVTDRRVYCGPAQHDIINTHTVTAATIGQVVRATSPTTLALSSVLGSEVNAAWTTFTPTFTQSVALTFTTLYAQYLLLGRIAFVRVGLIATSAGTASNQIVVGGLPAAILATVANATAPYGSFVFFKSATNTFYNGIVGMLSSTTLVPYTSGSTSYFGINPAVTVATSDAIYINGQWAI